MITLINIFFTGIQICWQCQFKELCRIRFWEVEVIRYFSVTNMFRDNRTSWDNLPSNNFHILKCCFELLEWFKLLLLILARLWRAFFNSCFIFFKNHVANYLSALTWLWNTKIIFSQDSTYQQLQQPTCNLQRMCSNCGSISPFTDSKTKLVADLSQNCIEFKNCFIYVQN